MKGKTAIFLLAAALHIGSSVSACVGPTNVEGVAFTNGEKLNFESLSPLGTSGVNYQIAMSDNGGTTVSYPSHYDGKVMAFFGNIGTSYQQDLTINCFGIIYPLSEETQSSHTTISKDVFDFTAAVKVELDWLSTHNILKIEQAAIDTIVASLGNAINGGVQYWTLHKKTLGYNSWYTNDSLNGTWGGNDMDGINGVKSVRGINGCSGIQIPAFEILQPVAVKERSQQISNKQNIRFSISGHTLKTQSLQANTPIDIKIVSVTGKVMQSFSVNGSSHHQIDLGNIVPGTYLIRSVISGTTLNNAVIIY
ncbi:MAG TPA: hypothetical protein VHO70_24145 [Chitinispirillaceae bacterium]|nr:hypothetical protein [Chitinispirillaceae bacterium]